MLRDLATRTQPLMRKLFLPYKLVYSVTVVACGLSSAPLMAEPIDWPELPKTCFVSRRPATVDDLNRGCSAFLIGGPEKSAGTPLNILSLSMHFM